MAQTEQVHWYKIYTNLADKLSRFYTINQKDSGRQLHKLCKKNKNFSTEHSWFDQLEADWGVKSLDPMHVFASCTGNTLKEDRRVYRLNLYLDILNDALAAPLTNYASIDISGCPSPTPIHLVGARDESDQEQVWEVFYQAFTKGPQGVREDAFELTDNWYGITKNGLSLLFFWCNSDNFLPLDKNTNAFLESRDINEPRTFMEYLSLLKLKDTSLYRTIALIAYSPKAFYELEDDERSVFADYFNIKLDEDDISEKNQVIEPKSGRKKEADKSTPDIYSKNRCRVLAVRPLKDCNYKFRKSLKENQLYKLYQSFDVIDDVINFDSEQDKALFDSTDFLQLNVSAIVGKNGSGKSTLLELAIVAINNLNYEQLTLKDAKHEFILVQDINLELYVETDAVYKLVFDKGDITITKCMPSEGYEYADTTDISVQDFKLENFFYSLNINYSLHGLNSENYGKWLGKLFHKNDAYQTPVVIEPYRVKGNIDINRQESLVKQRLLTNLLEMDISERDLKAASKENNLRYLKANAKANEIDLKIQPAKVNLFWEDSESNFKVQRSHLVAQSSFILKALFSAFDIQTAINFDVDCHCEPADSSVENIVKLYILKKLVSISLTYSEYKRFFDKRRKQFNDNRLEKFVVKLAEDTSHITFKLRQAINFLDLGVYKHVEKQTIKIPATAKAINDIKQQYESSNYKTEYLIPPSIFEVDIFLESDDDSERIEFSTLSSGEKQKIFSINSILYHIKNLDSVNSKNLIKYKYVNIFLDEIELCFHPEMQRVYLNELLIALNKLNLEKIRSINLCFVTHSPFVLSDIPACNILFLEQNEGLKTIPSDKSTKTFAANIHDLLADGFFMKHSIGAFAEEKIREIISIYSGLTDNNEENLSGRLDIFRSKYTNNRELYRFVHESIADEYIKGVVWNHIRVIEEELGIGDDIEREINMLKDKIKSLEEKAAQHA